MHTQVAVGIQLLIGAGWQLLASADEQRTCDEIELISGNARASIEVISSGGPAQAKAFADNFRFTLLTSLSQASCQIDSADKKRSSWITARHSDFDGQILHYIKPGSPLIHVSAASVTSKDLRDEIELMATSIQVDTEAFDEYKDLPIGTVLPISLTPSLWERQ
jgi:hypothetical protein